MEIRQVVFNLVDDIPPEIGTLITGKYDKRYYGVADILPIEKSLARMLKSNFTPEEDVELDIVLYGKINGALLTLLTLDINKWGHIHGLVHIKPGDEPVRLLPRDNGFVWNG